MAARSSTSSIIRCKGAITGALVVMPSRAADFRPCPNPTSLSHTIPPAFRTPSNTHADRPMKHYLQECMLCLAICLVVAALSHRDGVVSLLRVEVGVPGVSGVLEPTSSSLRTEANRYTDHKVGFCWLAETSHSSGRADRVSSRARQRLAQLQAQGPPRRSRLGLRSRDSLVRAPNVDGVADKEGRSEVGDLLGDAAHTPEDVAVKGTLHRLLGEGRDGYWASASGASRGGTGQKIARGDHSGAGEVDGGEERGGEGRERACHEGARIGVEVGVFRRWVRQDVRFVKG